MLNGLLTLALTASAPPQDMLLASAASSPAALAESRAGNRPLVCWVNGYTCVPCEAKLQDCAHFRTDGPLFGVSQPAAVIVRHDGPNGLAMTTVAAGADAYPAIRAAVGGAATAAAAPPPTAYWDGRTPYTGYPATYACGPNGCGPQGYAGPAGYYAVGSNCQSPSGGFYGTPGLTGPASFGGCEGGNCGGQSAPQFGGPARARFGGGRVFGGGGLRGGRRGGGGGCPGGGCGG